MTQDHAQLEELVSIVDRSANYKDIATDLVRHIGAVELAKRRNLREAVKATKNKLHQVAGAYIPKQQYNRWLSELRSAASSGQHQELRSTCKRIMAFHASTRERLPILDEFYNATLGNLPPIHSVLDIACGLNPLSIPWMPLAEPVEYRMYDIFQEQIRFLCQTLPLLGVSGSGEATDVTVQYPTARADLALVLKALPCLEQLDKSVGLKLLESLNVRYILVSYPVQTLGGRRKGMSATYEARCYDMVASKPWAVTRYEFSAELAFLVVK